MVFFTSHSLSNKLRRNERKLGGVGFFFPLKNIPLVRRGLYRLLFIYTLFPRIKSNIPLQDDKAWLTFCVLTCTCTHTHTDTTHPHTLQEGNIKLMLGEAGWSCNWGFCLNTWLHRDEVERIRWACLRSYISQTLINYPLNNKAKTTSGHRPNGVYKPLLLGRFVLFSVRMISLPLSIPRVCVCVVFRERDEGKVKTRGRKCGRQVRMGSRGVS